MKILAIMFACLFVLAFGVAAQDPTPIEELFFDIPDEYSFQSPIDPADIAKWKEVKSEVVNVATCGCKRIDAYYQNPDPNGDILYANCLFSDSQECVYGSRGRKLVAYALVYGGDLWLYCFYRFENTFKLCPKETQSQKAAWESYESDIERVFGIEIGT